jgi:hypothetical protein
MWTVRLRERRDEANSCFSQFCAKAPNNLSSLVIGNNIATGFSDYLTLLMKQRQMLHKELLLIAQSLTGGTNKYLFKSHIKITAL